MWLRALRYPVKAIIRGENKPAFRTFCKKLRQLGFDDLAAGIQIKLHVMFDDVEYLLRQINLLQGHFGLIERNQAATVFSENFFRRKFVDFLKRRRDRFRQPQMADGCASGVRFGHRFCVSSFSSGQVADRQYQMMAAWRNWMFL